MQITKSINDIFYEGEIPANTNTDTFVLPVGGTLGGLEIVAEKLSDITLSGNLKIQVMTSDNRATNFKVVSQVEVNKDDIDKGVFFSYTPSISDNVFFKIKLSTTDSSAKGNIAIYTRINRR